MTTQRSIFPNEPDGSRLFDVIVVGGGCVGTAVAMFAARNGFQTALVEKDDFGAGATGASTEMVHGGLQYLFQLRLGIVRQSNEYARRIVASARHLCRPLPIVVPCYRGGPIPWPALRLVMRLYERYNRRYKHAPPAAPLTASQVVARVPGIRREGLTGGMLYHEWWIDAARLCLTNALDAASHGAVVHNHATVVGLGRAPNGNWVVAIDDTRSGARHRLMSRVVVNATGPWTDRFIQLAGDNAPPRIRPTRGAHVFVPKVADVALLVHFVDGRFGIVLPRGHQSMIGTTDDDYYGDLDDLHATADEAAYLVQGAQRFLPELTVDRIIDTKVGIRPTIFQYGKNEDKLSRRHCVEAHVDRSLDGLISVYGGKLATHTLMAEDVLHIVASRLDRSINIPANYLLHGTPDDDIEDFRRRVAQTPARHGLAAEVFDQLVGRYGTGYERIVELISSQPALAENLCRCRRDDRAAQHVLAAEVHYAYAEEMALTGEDIRRRTGLGLGQCRQADCLDRATAILRTLVCRTTDSAAGPHGAPTATR